MRAKRMAGQGAQLTPEAALLQLRRGYWTTSLMSTFVAMGLPELLKAEPKSVEELANSTNSHPGHLYRMLRALAALEFVEELDFEKHVFTLRPLGQVLTIDHPRSMRNVTLMMGLPALRLAWMNLQYSVETGNEAFTKTFGKDFWAYSLENPEMLNIFDGAMSEYARNGHSSVVEAFDFSDIKRLVDVGGGRGALMNAILSKYEDMEGVVFDRPQVVAGEAQFAKSEKVRQRLQFVGGDFFQSVPESGAYIMSAILHDWADEPAIKILQTIHKSAAEGARLLIVDYVVQKDNALHRSKILDIHMMVVAGGKERTEEEWAELLEKGGFKLVRTLPTRVGNNVVEAVKI